MLKKFALLAIFFLFLSCQAKAQQVVRVVSGVATLDVERYSKFKVIVDQTVTSVVISPSVGVPNLTTINVLFVENSAGGFSVTFGGNTSGTCTITTTANAGSFCSLQFDSSSNTWFINGGAAAGGGLPSGGTAGQVVVNTAPGAGSWQDPNVSYTPVNLFNAVSATGTQTSTKTKNPTYNQSGTFMVTWASITGSPSGCTLQVQAVDSLGNAVNNGTAIAVTPSNGTSGITVSAGTIPSSAQIAVVYACSTTYPTTGTLSLDFAPSVNGRLTGNNSINNGYWVQVGDVIWAQYTTTAAALPASANTHQSVRIIQENGAVAITNWDVTNCLGAAGLGTGFTVTTPGFLQPPTAEVTNSVFPWSSVLVNWYILNSMPTGGGTGSCVNTLSTTQIGVILTTAPSGTFLPVSGGTNIHPWSIPGYTGVMTAPQPAAGAEWVFNSFGSGGRYCIQAVSFNFTTSATAGNRTVGFRLLGPGGTGSAPQMWYIAGISQAPSTTITYSFTPGANVLQYTASGATVQTNPFTNGSPVCYNGNFYGSIQSLTQGLQAGDQYATIGLLMQIQTDVD